MAFEIRITQYLLKQVIGYMRSMDEYDIDFLTDQFLAALSKESASYVERADVVLALRSGWG